MNKYKIAIWEEVSGFIDVEAKSKEEAILKIGGLPVDKAIYEDTETEVNLEEE